MFLEEELMFIDSISITKSIIPYLKYFKNIKYLNIECDTNFSSKEINDIINMFPNLLYLTIKGQYNLRYLDLNLQKNLQGLILESNPMLVNIYGIERLENLFEIEFFENNYFSYSKTIAEKALDMVLSGCIVKIDLLYMSEMLEVLEERNMSIEDLYHLNNLKWCEHLIMGYYGEENFNIEYNTKEFHHAYKIAEDIVKTYTKETDSEKEVFAILNEWMCKNVVYDDAAYDDGEKHMHRENGQIYGTLYGANGAINAFIYKTCVCQGYAKAM